MIFQILSNVGYYELDIHAIYSSIFLDTNNYLKSMINFLFDVDLKTFN